MLLNEERCVCVCERNNKNWTKMDIGRIFCEFFFVIFHRFCAFITRLDFE